MAIKTKKISDLGTIDISAYGAGNLTDADFYFLACKSGITGKVATRDLVAALGVGEKASAVTVSDDATPATFSMIGGEN